MKEKAVVYIHGKGGDAKEAQHYVRFFEDSDVIGFDYMSQTPWDAMEEFVSYFEELRIKYKSIIIIANSIGAYFALHALADIKIEKAFFISPVVDMEKLINDMMQWAGVSEEELMKRRLIETSFGETLSIEYLDWVRQHQFAWTVPTAVLHGSCDNMQSIETIKTFSNKFGAGLTVMEKGEHWFHTDAQMAFLDEWLENAISL